jgi:hypothetical protein
VPIARYFIFVGGTLAVLLFIPGWLLPNVPATIAHQSVALDRVAIRIKSAHKWPEKVILDISQPTITPPVVTAPPAIQSSSPLPSNKASNLEAAALLQSDTRPAAINRPTRQSKLRMARTARSRHAARGPVIHRRTVMSRDCCQFGWVDRSQTSSNAMPPRRAAPSWSLD